MNMTIESIEREAQEAADRKLCDILDRYGDAGGERRKPYYREQLIREAKASISWRIFSVTLAEADNEMPRITDQSTRGKSVNLLN